MLGGFKGIHIRPDFSDDEKGGGGADTENGDELLYLGGFRGSFIEDDSLYFSKMETQCVIVFQHKVQKIPQVF